MIKIKQYNIEQKAQSELALDLSVVEKSVALDAFSCAVKRVHQNRRQGTVGCKERGDVSFSGQKPWRQKGTGRARAGTKASPLWRKGGVIFGPQPRDKALKMSRRQRLHVFNNLFFAKQKAGDIYAIDGISVGEKPSTKVAYGVLKGLGLHTQKTAILLSSTDYVHVASFRNLTHVRILFYDQLNAFDLANARAWIFLTQDREQFKQMVEQWN